MFCIAVRREKKRVLEEARKKEKYFSEEVMSWSKNKVRGQESRKERHGPFKKAKGTNICPINRFGKRQHKEHF